MMRSLLRIGASCLVLLAATHASCSVAEGRYVNSSGQSALLIRDGSRTSFAIEQWRFVGSLHSDRGRSFDYNVTFFRYSIARSDGVSRRTDSRWIQPQIFEAVSCTLDRHNDEHACASTSARGVMSMGSATQDRLSVNVNTWSARMLETPDIEHTKIAVSTSPATGASIALDLSLGKVPAELEFVNSDFRNNPLHVVLYTRLDTTGVLTFGRDCLRVSGSSWLAHEFGSTFLPKSAVGWDLFFLQFDDGRDLLRIVIRKRDGTASTEGYLIDAKGHTDRMPSSSGYVKSSPWFWRSEHTAIVYPDLWTISIPTVAIEATVTPTQYDQEIIPERGKPYWDGTVDIQGLTNGRARIGQGYVQLVGYGVDNSR
jgi:predicted secreted hydrolase